MAIPLTGEERALITRNAATCYKQALVSAAQQGLLCRDYSFRDAINDMQHVFESEYVSLADSSARKPSVDKPM